MAISPSVSIIIPIHGKIPYFQETWKSILNQSLVWELIVVLDRPTDELMTACKAITQNDPRVKIIESMESGISNALNIGIINAKSNIIARIDSDDIMAPERLQIQFDFLSCNPNVAMVGSQYVMIDKDSVALGVSNLPTSSVQIKNLLKIKNCVAHPTVMYRRDAIRRAGMYDSHFDGAEDFELWTRLARLENICNLNVALTYYRIHPAQITFLNRGSSREILLAILIQETEREAKSDINSLLFIRWQIRRILIAKINLLDFFSFSFSQKPLKTFVKCSMKIFVAFIFAPVLTCRVLKTVVNVQNLKLTYTKLTHD